MLDMSRWQVIFLMIRVIAPFDGWVGSLPEIYFRAYLVKENLFSAGEGATLKSVLVRP